MGQNPKVIKALANAIGSHDDAMIDHLVDALAQAFDTATNEQTKQTG